MRVLKVPSNRIRTVNRSGVDEEGDHILYWMTATRRTGWNYGLQRAVEHARERRRPLLVLEALRVAYPWANVRHHRFALEGMYANGRALGAAGVGYFPYVEPRDGAGSGLLEALASRACLVVTDDSPAFFLPRMVEAAGRRLEVRLEAIDSCGLLPLAVAERDFTTAYSFRRFLQKTLPDALDNPPMDDPLAPGGFPRIPDGARSDGDERWAAADLETLVRDPTLGGLPIDRGVGPGGEEGGQEAARERLDRWLADGFNRYHEARNIPDDDAASGLSPWLHWGHLSPHEVFSRVAGGEGWHPGRLATATQGKREGWWGMGPAAEAFLDELITWRELGHVTALRMPRYDRYDSLPGWALGTLEDHLDDPRPHLYTQDNFREGTTHDPLWNAAQRQLREEGRIHNYLRMLWGKKILEWSGSPREALDTMIELNNRYALDGRDPNSVSGIFWVLGRYDRGWPERPIYGKVRSMSSDSTRRKVSVKGYLERWGG